MIGVGDEILDIAVTPDRGYALSIRGIAREVAIAYGVPFTDPGTALADLPAPLPDRAPQECGTDDPTGCDLFTMRTIVGFDPSAPSPQWMQRRLVACGMRPVSLAVDVTNYVMLELGQPLHAYDMDKLVGVVRAGRAADGEPFESLDHVQRRLASDDLVIRDDTGVIGLAGVIGGLHSEIDDGTTTIALEAAHFAPEVIARAGRRHKVSSEAGKRNERGVDRDLAPYASARAAALLLQFGGGHYVGMTAVEAGQPEQVIDLPADEPGAVAGMPIAAEAVGSWLEAIGCEVADRDAAVLRVTPPSWRPDLTDPIDLVEEVIRLNGYDLLPSTLPAAPLGRGLTRPQRLRRRVGTVLAARGLVEVLTYPFVGSAELDALRLPADDDRRRTPRLANPLSEEQPFLRGTLLPGLVSVAKRNAGRGTPDLAIFEIGSVFLGDVADSTALRPPVHGRPTDEEWTGLNDLLPHQPTQVAALLSGVRERRAGGVLRGRQAGRTPWRQPGWSLRLAESPSQWRRGMTARSTPVAARASCSMAARSDSPRAAPAGDRGVRAARPLGGHVARPGRGDRGGARGAIGTPRGHPAPGQGGSRRGGRSCDAGRRGRGRARGGRGGVAGVGAAVRRLRGSAGTRRQEVAGLRAALPRP